MKEHKVPVQSLIDHIKTAVDVDPWAKEMVEELLKEQEPVKPTYEDFFGTRIARCGKCNGYIVRYRYCLGCGRKVKWDG